MNQNRSSVPIDGEEAQLRVDLTSALLASIPERGAPGLEAASTLPVTRGWLAALADAYHALPRLARANLADAAVVSHTREKLAEVLALLSRVAGSATSDQGLHPGESFPLVVEALRNWDDGSLEEQSPRMFVVVDGVDEALLRKLDALVELVRSASLEEATFRVDNALWGGGVGRDERSVLVASASGLVSVRLQTDRGVFESLPFPVAAVREAWAGVQTFVGAEKLVAAWTGTVYVGAGKRGVVDLIQRSSCLEAVSRIEAELAAAGYRMEASLSSLDSEDDGDSIEVIGGEVVEDETELPEHVLELARAWTTLHRERAARVAEFERVRQAGERRRPRG